MKAETTKEMQEMSTERTQGKNHQAQVVHPAVHPQVVPLLQVVPVRNLLIRGVIKKIDNFLKTKNKDKWIK